MNCTTKKSKLNFILIISSSLVIIISLLWLNLSFLPKFLPKSTAYKPKDFVITHGDRNKKEVALTFDADLTPSMLKDLKSGKIKSWYNEKIIEILRKEKVQATIFMVGMWMEAYPEVAKSLAEDPLFELGNHSYSHPAFTPACSNLTLIPDSKDEQEIVKTQKILKEITGTENYLFRFPGGCHAKADEVIVHKLGLDIIDWDVASGDSFNPNTQEIINNVTQRTQNGSIVLFHLHDGPNAPKTAEALPTIIKFLKDKGYSFVKVSEMIKSSN